MYTNKYVLVKKCLQMNLAESAEAVEYTDCISVEW